MPNLDTTPKTHVLFFDMEEIAETQRLRLCVVEAQKHPLNPVLPLASWARTSFSTWLLICPRTPSRTASRPRMGRLSMKRCGGASAGLAAIAAEPAAFLGLPGTPACGTSSPGSQLGERHGPASNSTFVVNRGSASVSRNEGQGQRVWPYRPENPYERPLLGRSPCPRGRAVFQSTVDVFLDAKEVSLPATWQRKPGKRGQCLSDSTFRAQRRAGVRRSPRRGTGFFELAGPS